MCALENGRSIDSTMTFTALDGLPMGPGRARSIPAWCCT
jgi:acetate kinase